MIPTTACSSHWRKDYRPDNGDVLPGCCGRSFACRCYWPPEDAPVFVYEFEEATAAQTAAADVSTDAYSMTIIRTEGEVTYVHHSDWLETPHVYLNGRVIVVTGDDPLVVRALDTLLGPPLAPRSPG